MNDRYHYVLNGDGSEELYDIIADPTERNDLAESGSAADVLERFRSELRNLLGEVPSAGTAPAAAPSPDR